MFPAIFKHVPKVRTRQSQWTLLNRKRVESLLLWCISQEELPLSCENEFWINREHSYIARRRVSIYLDNALLMRRGLTPSVERSARRMSSLKLATIHRTSHPVRFTLIQRLITESHSYFEQSEMSEISSVRTQRLKEGFDICNLEELNKIDNYLPLYLRKSPP